MAQAFESDEGEVLGGIYDLLRLVAARSYNLTSGEAARLSTEQLDDVAAAAMNDPALRWRITWAQQDAAVAEARRILGIENDNSSA